MPPTSSDDIREAFLSYFESKGHLRVASSSLIPVGDPTLLLTNAGMVQFKPYFSRRVGAAEQAAHVVAEVVQGRRHRGGGRRHPRHDVRDAGQFQHRRLLQGGRRRVRPGVPRHGYGAAQGALRRDRAPYRRRGARYLAQGRHTRRADLQVRGRGQLVGPADPRRRGPVRPLLGAALRPRPGARLRPGRLRPELRQCDAVRAETCDRYVELWNLVFMQFYHHPDGSRDRLPATGIDTGMGFERLVTVLQGVDTVYATDLFKPLVARVEEISGDRLRLRPRGHRGDLRGRGARQERGVPAGGRGRARQRGPRVRATAHRAAGHQTRPAGMDEPFLGQIADAVTELMGDAYPELRKNREFVQTVIDLDEESFHRVFDTGSRTLAGMLEYREFHRGALPEFASFAQQWNPALRMLERGATGLLDTNQTRASTSVRAMKPLQKRSKLLSGPYMLETSVQSSPKSRRGEIPSRVGRHSSYTTPTGSRSR